MKPPHCRLADIIREKDLGVNNLYWLQNEMDRGIENNFRLLAGEQLFVAAVFRDETRAHGRLRVGKGLKGQQRHQ